MTRTDVEALRRTGDRIIGAAVALGDAGAVSGMFERNA
jgi:hypothetical protein